MKHVVMVPGRTELAGNHTDHQGGRVLAAAVDLYLRAEAEETRNEIVTLDSRGFGTVSVSLDELSPEHSKPGSAEALARGTLEYLKKEGWVLGPLRAELTSEIPVGAGLSSSAAFGVMVGKLQSVFHNAGEIPPLTLALAAQYGETAHFLKPCCLMDQAACALGGVNRLDFLGNIPKAERISSSLFAPEYRLLILDTGGSHRDLTSDYAAIPADMKAAASFFGKTRLRDVEEADFLASLPELRRKCGDRAALRALHFFEEDRRVPAMAMALKQGDAEAYLRLMDASGRSSAEVLQNVYAASSPESQPIPLALALSRRVLGGEGAARVHGGGFAGTVQVLAPAERVPLLRETLEPVFGPGSLREVHVSEE
ncbi:MAG: galactokinase [Oscillospiraceae bacterium]|nr:galactokinase [Oscillospiraceae bacterium]